MQSFKCWWATDPMISQHWTNWQRMIDINSIDASLQIPIVYWWIKDICQALTRQLRCELQLKVTGFVSL